MKKHFKVKNTLGDKLAYVFIEDNGPTIYRITTHVNDDGVVSLKPMDECDVCRRVNFRAYQRFGYEACREIMYKEALKNGYKYEGL